MLIFNNKNDDLLMGYMGKGDTIFTNESQLIGIPCNVGLTEDVINNIPDSFIENFYSPTSIDYQMVFVPQLTNELYLKWVKNKGMGFNFGMSYIC